MKSIIFALFSLFFLCTAGNAVATAPIGGDFTLTDTSGKTVTDQSFMGKYRLVFFGFTHCPEMCPMAMGTISTALKNFPASQKNKLQPIFIGLDPARDTPAALKEFLANFDSSFIGLTGSEEAVQKMVTLYRAYAAKQQDENSPDGYTINHTGLIYLMDKEGAFLRFFPHTVPPAELRDALIQNIR